MQYPWCPINISLSEISRWPNCTHLYIHKEELNQQVDSCMLKELTQEKYWNLARETESFKIQEIWNDGMERETKYLINCHPRSPAREVGDSPQ